MMVPQQLPLETSKAENSDGALNHGAFSGILNIAHLNLFCRRCVGEKGSTRSAVYYRQERLMQMWNVLDSCVFVSVQAPPLECESDLPMKHQSKSIAALINLCRWFAVSRTFD